MTGSKKQRIVLSTRSLAPGDEDVAQEFHFRLLACPSHSYQWIIPPHNVMNDVLTTNYDAWVFTSRRGVEGWHRVWNELADNVQASGLSRIPPVYAVGNSTKRAIRERFEVSDVRTTEEQRGTILARRMIADSVQRAIHFCGAVRRLELSDVCRKNQVELTEVEVYRRTDIREPEPEIVQICNSGQAEAILFFSPDGVTGFCRLYGVPGGDWVSVAVGPTTAEAIRKETGREPRVAPAPTIRDMIRLL